MLNYPIVNNHDDLTNVVDLILSEAGLDRKDQGGTRVHASRFSGRDDEDSRILGRSHYPSNRLQPTGLAAPLNAKKTKLSGWN